MPVCQVCQKDNQAGAEYCEDCGAALSEVSAPSTDQAATPATLEPESNASLEPPSSESAGFSPSDSGATETTMPEDVADDESASTAASPSAEGTSGAASPPGGATPAAAQHGRLVAMRYGAPTGDEIPLLGQRLVVGRFDPETGPVDVDLSAAAESTNISRHHGEMYLDGDGQWMVRDLGSTNGIFVKGSGDASFGPRITAPSPLADGDEIAFGNARFIFRTD